MAADSVLIYPNGREVPRSIPMPSTSSQEPPPRAFTQQTAAAHGLYPQSLAGTPAAGVGGRGGGGGSLPVHNGKPPHPSYGAGGGSGMVRDADMHVIERSSVSELPGYRATVPMGPSNLGGGRAGSTLRPPPPPPPPPLSSAHYPSHSNENETERMLRELKDLMPVAPGDSMTSAGGAGSSMFGSPTFPASPNVSKGGMWPEEQRAEEHKAQPSNGRRAGGDSPRHSHQNRASLKSEVAPDDIEGLLKQNEDKLSMLQHLNRLSGGGNPEAIEDFLLKFSKAKPTSAEPIKPPLIRVQTPQGHPGASTPHEPYDTRTMSADRSSRRLSNGASGGGLAGPSSARPLLPSSSFNRAWSAENMAPGSTPMATRQLPPRSPMASHRPSGGGGDALDREYPMQQQYQRGSNSQLRRGGLPPRGPLPPHMSLVDKEYQARPGTSDSMASMQGATSAFLLPS